MFDAITEVPAPVNEPVHNFAPGNPERTALEARLKQLAAERVELTMTIGGEQRLGGGDPVDVVQPHRKDAVLGTLSNATAADVKDAIEAARAAAPGWQRMSYDDRAAVFLKAADLLAGPWRNTLAAATMLGQSKTCYQAEIDTPCELVDFWRFNVHFGRQIRAEQPMSSPGVWNRFDHRPLEGFVLAITPFNFTAIAGNLPTAALGTELGGHRQRRPAGADARPTRPRGHRDRAGRDQRSMTARLLAIAGQEVAQPLDRVGKVTRPRQRHDA